MSRRISGLVHRDTYDQVTSERDAARAEVEQLRAEGDWLRRMKTEAQTERDALKAALRELLENPSHPDAYLSGEHDKAVQRAREALKEEET